MLDNLTDRWLLTERPRVFADGDALVIADGWKSHLLRLGSFSRMARIDPKAKVVGLKGRRFWFGTWSRAIPFSRIDQIEYGYEETGGSYDHQEHDKFTLGLRLTNGESVHLCTFTGLGGFMNNSVLPDWMFPGEALEARITAEDQEDRSQNLADVLSGMIGVPITNPLP